MKNKPNKYTSKTFLHQALLATTAISSIFIPQYSLANITINSDVATQQNLSATDPTITISSAGNLRLSSGLTGNAPIKSDAQNPQATGLSVVVNATGTNGIHATGGFNGAIEIRGADVISSISLNSGNISSDKVNGGTISLMGGGSNPIGVDNVTATINVASGTSITNSASSGFAIESDTTSRTTLRINVAEGGTISVSDNAASSAIIFGDSNGFSALQVFNDGTISAGTNGNAIKTKATDGNPISATITNNASGTILGNLDFAANANLGRITNSGTIVGNILGGAQKAIVTSNAGSITGNITLGRSNISEIAFNGGTVTGDVTMNHSSQIATFRGGAFIGKLDGNGQVIIDTASQTLAGDIGSSRQVTSITVNAGRTLNMSSSSIDALAISLLNGSTLTAGSGTITGDIAIHSSTLNLNSTTIIGDILTDGTTLNLGTGSNTQTGALVLLANDTIATSISSSTLAGNITSSSAVTDPNTNLAVTVNYNNIALNIGSSYNIVSSTTGTIAEIDNSKINVNNANSNRAGLLSYSTTVSDNTLILHVTLDDVNNIGTNNVQKNILNVLLDSAHNPAPTEELLTLQNYVITTNNVTNEQRQDALQSAAANNAGLNKAVFDAATVSINSAEKRLEIVRNKKGIYDQCISDALWIQAFGSSAKQDNKRGFAGYKSTLGGIAFGADQKTDKDTTIGVSISIADSTIKASDSLKKTDIDSYQFNIYAGRTFNKYFVDLLAGFALNQYSSNRAIPLVAKTAKAKYHGETYLAKAKAGFVEQIGAHFELIPEASLTFARNSISNYTETGAGTLNLYTQNHDANFLEGTAGIGIGYNALSYQETRFYPKIKLTYGHDFLGNKQVATSNFLGSSTSFDTQSSRINRNSLRAEAGITAYHRNNVSVSANYILERKSTFKSHSGLLKVSYDF